ncbi:MAG TPA: HAMP domain-containing sensor histidine kinase [Acidimicrobiales bacterium]|jgi:two-component system OmpR family sensor kinase
MTSLRARLTVGLVVLAAIGLAVAAAITFSVLRSFLYDRVDQQLVDDQSAVLVSMGQNDFPRGRDNTRLPAGIYGELRDSTGATVASVGLTGPTVQSDPPISKAFTQGSWRVRVDPAVDRFGQKFTLAVAIPLTDAHATLSKLIWVELFVALAVLAVLGLLAWWVVKIGLRPLDAMGDTAGAIAAGDLSRRVEPADDRTEVGRLGTSLNAMLQQIEGAFAERTESENRLRRFVADAAHELRTPLTSIRGYSELFRRGAADRPDDLAKSMQRIEAEAERMGVLVDDLLLLARLDQGRPLEISSIDLVRITTDVVADARVANPERTISLAAAAGPVVVDGDEGRLRQAVQNLVVNATTHTPATAEVRVAVATEGEQAVIEVADDGPGISAEELPHLFERFYRIDHSRARSQGGGTGLGLSIVAAVAEAHGGTADVESELGAGAAFHLRFPLRRVPDRPVESAPASDGDAPPEVPVVEGTAIGGGVTDPAVSDPAV